MNLLAYRDLRRFEEHDSQLVIRRIISHTKFLHLLKSGSIYFAPASTFLDPREGRYTSSDYARDDKQLQTWGLDINSRRVAQKAKHAIAQHNSQAVVISCWTAGFEEDLLMWRTYGNGPKAVALETTVGSMRASLGSEFLITRVQYIDFEHDSIPRKHSLQPYCFKHIPYSWEREIRVIASMELGNRLGTPRMVPIEFQSLFQRVVVSPYAPINYSNEVINRLRAFNIDTVVEPSVL
jgi:hypothetical protein